MSYNVLEENPTTNAVKFDLLTEDKRKRQQVIHFINSEVTADHFSFIGTVDRMTPRIKMRAKQTTPKICNGTV